MTPQERWAAKHPGYYQLARPKAAGFVRHYGVAEGNYLGQCRVFELSPRGCVWTGPQQFADGENVTALSWKPLTEGSEILRRVSEVQRKYSKFSLLGNNCEHAARFIWTGDRESKQVKGFGWAAAALVALIIFGR